MTPDDLSEVDDDDVGRRSRQSSMPGSFEDRSNHFPDSFIGRSGDVEAQDDVPVEEDSFDDGAIFDDDLLATGEMQHVPF
jgi:phosphatidate phosphatase LPIN